MIQLRKNNRYVIRQGRPIRVRLYTISDQTLSAAQEGMEEDRTEVAGEEETIEQSGKEEEVSLI